MNSRTLFLAPDVHAVGVNGDLVFLDVERDAYICLPDGEQQAQLSADRAGLMLTDLDLADELARAGLAETSPRAGAADPTATAGRMLAPPTRSALRDSYELPRLADSVAIGLAVSDLLVAYRGRPFREILKAARRSRVEPPRLTAGLVATVEDFHRWAPFAPASAKCLLRAFMLLRLLHRRGHDALWVFGVRTWPFHAHCWLQCEDLVLDDEPDRIRAFTPILVA